MAQVGKIIGGAALIAGAVALDVATGGAAFAAGAEEFTAFLGIVAGTGASLVASGTAGLLAARPPAHGVTSNNPIAPWQIAYGEVLVPGTYLYLEDNGGILSNGSNEYNKAEHQVIGLAAHPIKSVKQVRLNGKPILLGPGGTGAQSTQWTYTPPTNQSQTSISSISRADGVVTLHLASALAGQNGLQLAVQYVNDRTYNGTFTVTQPDPSDNTTFTYLCSGPDGSSSDGYVLTTYPNWKNRVHVDLTSCLGDHTSTFPELLSTSTLWTSAHKNLGKASVYMAYYYDQEVFANDRPTSSFVIEGYNKVFDPRLGAIGNVNAYVYTQNPALIIADYLTNSQWGYGLSYGIDVPLDPLIAAANICDEGITLAAGGTEKRYTLNMTFSLARSRGEVLQDMLGSCAGRISTQSGQVFIIPGAWVGASLSLSEKNLIGPLEYTPNATISEAYNGVKGTYTSAVSGWQATDVPPYAEDALHGFDSDRWLAADGGSRLWKDASYPATTSCSTAQRLEKIDLERMRREGRGTLHCNMSAYSAVALDVIDFSYPRYGWDHKTFEILSSKFVIKQDANGGAPTLGVDLEIAETDASVTDWSTSEELTPADTPSPAIDNGQIVLGPQTVVVESGTDTAYTGADGIVLPRLLVSWAASGDASVQSGGYVDVQYQKSGDSAWTFAGRVPAAQKASYISGVVSGTSYYVQAQSYSVKGVPSGWAQAGPVNASATTTSFAASSVKYTDGTPVSALQPSQAGADMTAAQTIVYAGLSESIVDNGTFILGNFDGWRNSGNFTLGTDPNYGRIAYRAPSYGGDGGLYSPTFSVIPGKKYRLTYRVYNGSGDGGIYLRVAWQATYAPNILPVGGTTSATVPGYVDVFAGSIPNNPTDYTYNLTVPAGAYFASMMVYNIGSSDLALQYVSCVPFAAVGQYGADVTGSNTAGDTYYVGGVAAGTIAGVIPNGSKLFLNSGSRTYSIQSV